MHAYGYTLYTCIHIIYAFIHTHKHKRVYMNMQYSFLLDTRYRFLTCSNFQNSNAKFL